MSNEKEIKSLKTVARVLEKEYNGQHLLAVAARLKALGDESAAEEYTAKAAEATLKRASAMNDTDGMLQKKVKPLAEQDLHEPTAATRTALKQAAQEYCETHPLSVFGWYIHYWYVEPADRCMTSVLQPEEHIELLLENKDSIPKLVHICVERISLAHEDYDTAYAVYIALGEFEKARGVRYKQGIKAYEAGDFEKAGHLFEEALTHEGAQEMLRKTAVAMMWRQHFLKRVGDPNKYLRQKMDECEPVRMRELRAARRVSSEGGEYGAAWFFYLVGFVLSVIMHTDPGLDNNMLYIFFPIAVSIGIHAMFDMEFGWIKSLAITFGILILPKIFADFSVEWFDTPTPAFVLLNLLAAVPLVITLVDLFRTIPANRAKRRADALTSELLPIQSKICKELVDEYAPEVGREVAEKWVKELRGGV